MDRFIVEKGVLDLSGRNLSVLRGAHLEHCQSSTLHLNAAHNQLQDLSFLQGFTVLQTLILDYNLVESLQSLPPLDDLDTLSLNCNKLIDLQALARDVSLKCPNLQHLSLIQNPACPLLDPSSSEGSIRRYRTEVIKAVPMLKSLDGSMVTPAERAEAMAAKANRFTEQMTPVTLSTEDSDAHRHSTRVKIAKEPKRPPKGMSEGNRFITNQEL